MKPAGRVPSGWCAEKIFFRNGCQTCRRKENVVDEKPRETTVEFLASLAELLVIVLFIMTFVLQNFEIPSSSMEDTLLIGDHVFVNREQFAPPTRWIGPLLPYRDVRRNDIAVFLSPEEQGLFLVKRIIGIPGDRIRLRDGVVYRNGEKLVEPYVQHKLADYNPYRDNFPGRAAFGNVQRTKRKVGGRICLRIWRAATLSCLRTVTLPWATTAT